MIQEHTYGKSPAAVNLAKMVNEHPNSKVIARKVGRLFEHMNYAMNKLELIPDRRLVERLQTLLLKDMEDNHMEFLEQPYLVRPTSELEGKIRTHVLNVMQGRYKSWYRGDRDDICRFEDVNDDVTIVRRPSGRVSVHMRATNGVR